MRALGWSSKDNHLLLNQRLPAEFRERFESAWRSLVAERFESVVGIATSGSSNEDFGRLIVLSKAALIASAKAVNERLRSDKSDIWFRTLPLFHVGGLGIMIRAELSGAKVVEDPNERWEPSAFHERLIDARATQLSLVPTQLFDLVQLGLRAPSSLRSVVIGGGRMVEELRLKAVSLGWPVLPSYGMTECCSQIATAASMNDPKLIPLPHVQLRMGAGDRLEIKSSSLLTAQITFDTQGIASIKDPKHNHWFTTEDVASIEATGELKVLGRTGDFVKIGGEGVIVSRLEERLERLKLESRYKADFALLAASDERLGAKIVLVASETSENVQRLLKVFNEGVLPFEVIREVYELAEIPRSPLGKLLRGRALSLIGLKAPANF